MTEDVRFVMKDGRVYEAGARRTATNEARLRTRFTSLSDSSGLGVDFWVPTQEGMPLVSAVASLQFA